MSSPIDPLVISQDSQDFGACFQDLMKSASFIRSPDYFLGEILSYIENPIQGSPCFVSDRLRFRPGEVTIWAAPNGNGKSLLTGQQCMHFVRNGERVLLMSMEMAPRLTILRMMQQCFGFAPRKKDIELCKQWVEWAKSKLFIFDKSGAMKIEDTVGAVAYTGKVLKAKHVVIDNLICCVNGENGDQAINAQKDFIQKMVEAAIACNIHIHVVHHTRKCGKETDIVSKYDLRGSSSIADLAANVIVIQRNPQKEIIRRERELTPDEDAASPDVFFTIAKQRNGDYEGRLGLWYDSASKAFSTFPDRSIAPLWAGDTTNPIPVEDIF